MPKTVVLSIFIKDVHLSVGSTVHEPSVPTAGKGVMNNKFDDVQDEHLVGSLLTEHSLHVEWQKATGTHEVTLSVNPTGQLVTQID